MLSDNDVYGKRHYSAKRTDPANKLCGKVKGKVVPVLNY
jgi:hypothetical protein